MADIRLVQKGHILQEAGQNRMKVYNVNKGLLRSFFTDENGKEHNFMFAPEGWIIADLDGISFGNASRLTIEALEESEVEIMEYAELGQNDWQQEFRRMTRRCRHIAAPGADADEHVGIGAVRIFLGIVPQLESPTETESHCILRGHHPSGVEQTACATVREVLLKLIQVNPMEKMRREFVA